MEIREAVQNLFKKLGTHKIMALATSIEDYPMVRNVSCVFYNEKIYFKTDKNFRKTQQLLNNSQVALCVGGVQVEGKAKNVGLVIDEPERKFETLYKKYWWESYNAYSHTDSEILIEVTPEFVEIWDQDKDQKGFQTFIDYKNEKVEIKYYDK